MSPVISIIINNFNYGQYVADAIESALAQRHRDVEVVVVDDGSSDNSREVIAGFGRHVTVLLQANSGQPAACNAGFAACHGDIVIFLDSDDTLLAHAADAAATLLAEHQAAKVHWPLWQIDRAGNRTGERYPRAELPSGDLRSRAIAQGPYSTASAPMSGNAFTRDALTQLLPIKDSGDGHGADAYLVALAPIVGPIARSEEPLGCYRMHGENFSKRSAVANIERHVRRFDFLSDAMRLLLERQGVDADMQGWKDSNQSYQWMKGAMRLRRDLADALKSGEAFVLIELGMLDAQFVPDHRAHLLLEHGGKFAGSPQDLETAVRELERLADVGVNAVVIPNWAEWWVDSIAGLRDYLQQHARVEVSNEHFTIHRLNSPIRRNS